MEYGICGGCWRIESSTTMLENVGLQCSDSCRCQAFARRTAAGPANGTQRSLKGR